ncbi:hypothetical protein PIB30_050260, partial [Stylosanthes scabra]|nr:hypothetical protein [Stylosanthes scabra]
MAASREMRSRMTQSMDDGCSDGFTDQWRTTKPFDGTCYCRLGVVALKSKTKNNPNRWFYRCPKWKVTDYELDLEIFIVLLLFSSVTFCALIVVGRIKMDA